MKMQVVELHIRMVRRKPATVIGVLGVEFDHHNWITIGCERAVPGPGCSVFTYGHQDGHAP